MNRRRLRWLVGLAVLAIVLLAAPLAEAAAGGGSAGFGGGGGGGGGGRGAGLYILIQVLIRIAIFGHGLGILILVGLALLAVLYVNVAPRARAFWSASQDEGRAHKRRSSQRQRRVELAAAEAAEEDPAFAPDVVKPAAANLFAAIQTAWDAQDRQALSRVVAPGLMAEWNRRLDDFERRGWRNRTQPIGEPRIEYVGLSNPGAESSKRVTVRVECKLRDFVEDRSGRHIKRAGRMSETISTREFWTLAKRNGHWILASIEQGAEGEHALTERITPTAWSDDTALRDEALTEQAMQDALPADVKPAEVADLDFTGDARAAALDLSLADGRFSPDLLEIAARRATDAWALGVDGDDSALKGLATPQVVRRLLHPAGPETRLVVRGPQALKITITGLDAAAEPPTMSIAVELSGRRYLEDRSTAAVVAGSRSRETRFTEHWTLALNGDQSQPWRIVDTGTPAAIA